jgi:hypothetical protein
MIMKLNMPEIDITKVKLPPEHTWILEKITVQKDGRYFLRASKPKINYKIIEKNGLKYRYPDKSGEAAYVWRMVAFMASPKGQHHCMPIMAFTDLPEKADWDEAKKYEQEMMTVADKIVNGINVRQLHGIHRWGHALGYL